MDCDRPMRRSEVAPERLSPCIILLSCSCTRTIHQGAIWNLCRFVAWPGKGVWKRQVRTGWQIAWAERLCTYLAICAVGSNRHVCCLTPNSPQRRGETWWDWDDEAPFALNSEHQHATPTRPWKYWRSRGAGYSLVHRRPQNPRAEATFGERLQVATARLSSEGAAEPVKAYSCYIN